MQSPSSWTIAAYGFARAAALRITNPLAYLTIDDWPLEELAAALLARRATVGARAARTLTST